MSLEAGRIASRILTRAKRGCCMNICTQQVAVSGTPDACLRGPREVAEAGAELILLNPLFDGNEQMERLASLLIKARSVGVWAGYAACL